ncbi:MAG: hypothetical protein Q4G34_11170 [Micrococcus sp.]|nr:hypothetical protein [Micrococcus sp.]
MTAMQCRRLVLDGQLEHAMYNVYLPEADRTPEERHALLTRAILKTDPLAFASHQSALALYEVPLIGVAMNQVHIADARKSSRVYPSLHRHVLRPSDPVVTVAGLPSLDPGFACLQVAARYGVRPGIVATDACLHRKLTSREALAAILESGRLRRGITAATTVLEQADARAESPGESLLRLVLMGQALSVVSQFAVPGTPYRADFLVDGRVVVEFDGEMKYEGVEGKEALLKEKWRQRQISDRGFEVVRVTWRELADPAEIQRRIMAAAMRARLRPAA